MIFLASLDGVTVNENLIGKNVLAAFSDGSFLYDSGRTAEEIIAEGNSMRSGIAWPTEDEMEQQALHDYLVEPVTGDEIEFGRLLTGKRIAAFVSWFINDSDKVVTTETIAEIVSENLFGPISKPTANFAYVSDLLIRKYRFEALNDNELRRVA